MDHDAPRSDPPADQKANPAPETTPQRDAATPDPASSPLSDDYRTVGSATAPRPRRNRGTIALTILVVALVASQVYLVAALTATRSELADLSTELNAVSSQVSGVDGLVFGINDKVDEVNARIDALEAVETSSTAPLQPGIEAGYLPTFVQGQQDQAIGLTLGTVEGPDAYSGEVVTIEPGDGTKRLWMVWAHWCPYCQEELPTLTAMYDDLVADFPTVELMTVTTSIDPTRGNPLGDYLEAQQFPFGVLVDEDLTLAGQFGVSACPFWVVTDGDGTVLLRLTGYLDADRVLGLMASLDDYEA
jgi:thiol-disulfide isomerase/thioredoxin